MKKLTQEEFFLKAQVIHGDRYDYSLTEYRKATQRVVIICGKHGAFSQTPYHHLHGHRCPKCSIEAVTAKLTRSQSEFLLRAKKIHGNRYDYSLVEYKNSLQKIIIVCPEHGEFSQTPGSHLQGRGCSRCGTEITSGKLSLSLFGFISKAKETHGNKYDYSFVEYKGSKVKVKIVCPEHGEFSQTAGSHFRGHGCPRCGTEIITSKRTLSLFGFTSKAKETHGNKYDYSFVEYKGSKVKVKIVCPEHGEFFQLPNNHLQGRGCPKCGMDAIKIKQIYSSSEFSSKAKEIHGDKYDYSLVEYKGSQVKVKIVCPEHGGFSQTPDHHLQGQGCPDCGTESRIFKRIKPLSEFLLKTKEVHGDNYDYSQVRYSGAKRRIVIVCKTHGEFSQTPCHHLSGCGCPRCANVGPSNPETSLYEFLKSTYTGVILQNDRKIISPKELDIVLPDLKIAIEFNGLYWHSAGYVDKNYHYEKYQACQKAGYRLIQVWEDDWRDRLSISENLLKHKLGGSGSPKIFARKCDISNPSISEQKEFYNSNHIQGYVGGSIVFSLVHNNLSVSMMSFRREKEGIYNLVRFATSSRVPGGFSKLLKHFERTIPYSQIISFADISISDGNMYKKNGFILDKIMKPDYTYLVDGKRVHKFNYRHTTGLKDLPTYDPELTEAENMQLAGIPRIYNSGLMRFVKNCPVKMVN